MQFLLQDYLKGANLKVAQAPPLDHIATTNEFCPRQTDFRLGHDAARSDPLYGSKQTRRDVA